MTDKFKVRADVGFFEETADDDDEAFLSHPRHGAGNPYYNPLNQRMDGYGAPADEAKRRQQQLMSEIDRIQQRTLDSSKRSLAMVHESEQVGVATAEELMQQREQLENCTTKMTEIDKSLRVTQKHLNSIKSWFGGMKNIFSKTPEGSTANPPLAPPKETSGISSRSEALNRAVEDAQSRPQYQAGGAHPGMILRGLDDEEAAATPANEDNQTSSRAARFKAAESQLDNNLDDLSLGLARLKGLALGLGEEIEDQNELVDKLNDYVEHVDMGIGRQNKQMSQILKK